MSIASILSVAGRTGARSVPRFLAVACTAALLISAVDVRAAVLNVGNVYTFSTGSTAGNPQGSWTLGDKTWSYADTTGFSTSSPGGPEAIQIIDTGVNTHSFQLGQLSSLTGSGTWALGYKLQITPTSPYFLKSMALDMVHLSNNATAYKDVFSSLSLFNAGSSTYGTGDLVTLSSTNGTPAGPLAIPGNLTQVWVRDWIVLDAGGILTTLSNTVEQTPVPEIDVASMAGAFPLLMAGLALLERRRRRPVGGDCTRTAG